MRQEYIIGIRWLAGLGFVALLLACIGFILPLDFALTLAFGWVFYLWRVVPQTVVNLSGVATATVCLVLLASGTHSFLTWIWGANGRVWKRRWTASLIGGVVVMFVAGIAATGVTHQIGWLLTSRERWVDGSGGHIAVRRSQSTNNLKQIGIGLHSYENNTVLPAGGEFDSTGRGLHGWQSRLLPYVEMSSIYNQINFSIPWDDPAQGVVFRMKPAVYLNPGQSIDPIDRRFTPSHYAGNALVVGGDVAKKLEDIKDGASTTLLAGEVAGEFKPWGSPTNWRSVGDGINKTPRGFGGPYPGGANMLFADGSVKFVKDTIDPRIFKAMGTPAGGETIPADWDR